MRKYNEKEKNLIWRRIVWIDEKILFTLFIWYNFRYLLIYLLINYTIVNNWVILLYNIQKNKNIVLIYINKYKINKLINFVNEAYESIIKIKEASEFSINKHKSFDPCSSFNLIIKEHWEYNKDFTWRTISH